MDRSLRLREEWEIEEVRRRGKAFAAGPLAARVLPQTSPRASNRYAVIAGKRVGGAVDRNRCKRLVREALRTLHPALRQGFDVAVIVRGGPDQLSGLEVASSLLKGIFFRAGMLDTSTAGEPLETPRQG